MNSMAPVHTQSRVVTINVGGSLHTTYMATLTHFPDSMLAAMFSEKHTMSTDDHGNFFIDRDGELFRYVLKFLRSPEEFEPGRLAPDLSRDLQSEARYYGILTEMFPFKPRVCSVFVGSINRENLIYNEKKIDNSQWVEWSRRSAVISRNDTGIFFVSSCPGHQPLRFEMLPLIFCSTCSRMYTILEPTHHSIVTIAMPKNEENIEDRRLILYLDATTLTNTFSTGNTGREGVSGLHPEYKVFRDQCGECFVNHQ